MKTKTIATALCISALFSTTAWCMMPRAIARLAARRSCTMSLKSGVRQLPKTRGTRTFCSQPEEQLAKLKQTNTKSGKRDSISWPAKAFCCTLGASAGIIGMGYIRYLIVKSEIEELCEQLKEQ